MKNVKYIGKEIIEMLNSNDENLIKNLNKLKKQFINQGWYDNINLAIKITKRGRKNPFNIIEKKLTDLDINIGELKY